MQDGSFDSSYTVITLKGIGQGPELWANPLANFAVVIGQLGAPGSQDRELPDITFGLGLQINVCPIEVYRVLRSEELGGRICFLEKDYLNLSRVLIQVLYPGIFRQLNYVC